MNVVNIKNPVIAFMCELAVTAKLYTAAISP
jgi:hypothetical protein